MKRSAEEGRIGIMVGGEKVWVCTKAAISAQTVGPCPCGKDDVCTRGCVIIISSYYSKKYSQTNEASPLYYGHVISMASSEW